MIVLQWISKHTGIKLPRFISKRMSIGNKNKISSTKEPEKQQHGIEEMCNDFWCLCKQRFSRKNIDDSTISTTSTEISTSFDEDDSDGEEVVIISEQKINNIHRSKKTKKTPNIQLVEGEWCMPCQESDEGR